MANNPKAPPRWCGCRYGRNGLEFCSLHGKAARMAALLRRIRRQIIDSSHIDVTGLIEELDELVPED